MPQARGRALSEGRSDVTKLLFSHYVIVIVSVFVIYGVVRVCNRIIRVLKSLHMHKTV